MPNSSFRRGGFQFIKSFFDDWERTITKIWHEGDLERVIDIVCEPKSKRKIKIGFEILKHTKITDEKRWQILFDPNLSKNAKKAFQMAKDAGLVQP